VRSSLICALAVSLALTAADVTPAAAGDAVQPGTFSGCPRDVRLLPTGPLTSYAPTVRGVVIRFVGRSFARISHKPAAELAGARTTALFFVKDWLPTGWIKRECGVQVWRRSVGVVVYFPALDKRHNPAGHCADCAHIRFFVSLTRGGWSVWGDQ
jgi:hypothetical protein